MNISTKGLKKVAQDDKKTTLQHPDGHQIVIAHSKLKPEHAAALLKMPMQKLADGGEVKPTAGSSSSSTGTYTPPSGRTRDVKASSNGISGADITKPTTWFAEGGGVPDVSNVQLSADQQQQTSDMSKPDLAGRPNQPTDNFMPNPSLNPFAPDVIAKSDVALQAPNNLQLSPSQQDQSSGMATAPSGPQPGNQDLSKYAAPQSSNLMSPNFSTKAEDQGIQGYQDMAHIQGDIAKSMQPTYEDNAKAVADLAQTQQAHIQNFNQESAKIIDAMNKGEIDPDHYMKSLSTGGKVSTAIGLLLGGIGGGMTHQANPALEFLNKQIDRDIDSQKANLGKQATLYSMLHQQFGSDMAATSAAKAMMTDGVISKLQAEANKNAGPMAQAQAKINTIQLQAHRDQLMNQATMMKTAKDALSSGSAAPGVQEQATRMYLSAAGASPEIQKSAATELSEVKGYNALQNNLVQSFGKLADKVGNGVLTPGDKDALTGPVSQQLQMLIDHRYNHDAAQELKKNVFPQPGDTANTLRDKLQQIQDTMNTAKAKATPTLDSFGLGSQQPAPIGKKAHNAFKK